MSIHVGSCAVQDTIVVNTRSSVYELIVLRGEEGDLLLRGGSLFPEFSRVLFLGSTAEGGSLQLRTIEIGNRMHFMCGDRLITTTAVQSLSACTPSGRMQQPSERIPRSPADRSSGSDVARGSFLDDAMR
jgi:hypothetical protein